MLNSLIDTLVVENNSYGLVLDNKKTGEKVVEKIQYLKDLYTEFIQTIGAQNSGLYELNQKLLAITVMDYFVDLARIKEFHPVGKANVYKRIGYIAYWFLKRKPIQIISDSQKVLADINERFMATYIVNEILLEINEINSNTLYWNSYWNKLPKERREIFFENWVYYLTNRNYDAQGLEFLVMNFEMGFMLSYQENAPDGLQSNPPNSK